MNALRIWLAALLCAALLALAACSPADRPAGPVDAVQSDAGPKAGSAADPQLSGALHANCEEGLPSGGIGRAGIPQGAPAVDFTLKDTDGRGHTLSAMLAQKPVMMVFGSFT